MNLMFVVYLFPCNHIDWLINFFYLHLWRMKMKWEHPSLLCHVNCVVYTFFFFCCYLFIYFWCNNSMVYIFLEIEREREREKSNAHFILYFSCVATTGFAMGPVVYPYTHISLSSGKKAKISRCCVCIQKWFGRCLLWDEKTFDGQKNGVESTGKGGRRRGGNEESHCVWHTQLPFDWPNINVPLYTLAWWWIPNDEWWIECVGCRRRRGCSAFINPSLSYFYLKFRRQESAVVSDIQKNTTTGEMINPITFKLYQCSYSSWIEFIRVISDEIINRIEHLIYLYTVNIVLVIIHIVLQIQLRQHSLSFETEFWW